jgi:hypothetical protein
LRRPKRRSSPAVLRRLASSDMVLELSRGDGVAMFDERWLLTIGRAVAERIAPLAAGARHEFVVEKAHEFCTLLTGEKRKLRAGERMGAMHLVPILALLEDELEQWPKADRLALWNLVALKGGRRERPFAQASRAHSRWWRTLADYCRKLESR